MADQSHEDKPGIEPGTSGLWSRGTNHLANTTHTDSQLLLFKTVV